MAFLLYRNPKSHSQQQEQHKNNIEPFIMALMDVCRRLQVNIGGIKRERERRTKTHEKTVKKLINMNMQHTAYIIHIHQYRSIVLKKPPAFSLELLNRAAVVTLAFLAHVYHFKKGKRRCKYHNPPSTNLFLAQKFSLCYSQH